MLQVKQLTRQQSSISQQVITILQFCNHLLTYLAMLIPFLLQGGFSTFAPTILAIPLATLQGLKVRSGLACVYMICLQASIACC